MAFADYTSQGAVAVITLKNPPVNALSQGLRTAIADGVERAAGDESIRAVVIVGSGSAFCGGADVSEFGLPAMSAISPASGYAPSPPPMKLWSTFRAHDGVSWNTVP